jgi:hypothetical protein
MQKLSLAIVKELVQHAQPIPGHMKYREQLKGGSGHPSSQGGESRIYIFTANEYNKMCVRQPKKKI